MGMGVKPILFMQSCMGPIGLFENPLFKKYVLGGGKSEEGVYGETTDPSTLPSLPETTATTPAPQEKENEELQVKGEGEEKINVMTEELQQHIYGVDEAGEKCTSEELLDIVKTSLTKENIDSVTPEEKWTSLMVFSGHPSTTADVMSATLALQPNCLLQDDAGDTALHFAVGSGRNEAVLSLLADSGLSKEEKKTLIMKKNHEGKTALELEECSKNEVIKGMLENELSD